MENRYGVIEGRFYMEDDQVMIHIEYYDRQNKEFIEVTFNVDDLEGTSKKDVNEFITKIVEEYEGQGGE